MTFYDIDRESGLKRAEQLVAKDRDGSKQTEKLSEFSPGPVGDDELLARSLDYPSKFDSVGGLNDSMFQDAFTHGASAQRLPDGWDAHACEVHERFENRAIARRAGSDGRAPEPDYLYVGAFHMTAAALRSCRLANEMQSRVRVYDAAGGGSDALHAEIVVDANGLSKPQRKELRVRLMTLAQEGGLYVSPHLQHHQFGFALRTQCVLVLPAVAVSDGDLCAS